LFRGHGFVLLIACANIANLLLASGRGIDRPNGGPLSMARPRTLVRQLLGESCLSPLRRRRGVIVAQWTMTLMLSDCSDEAADTVALKVARR